MDDCRRALDISNACTLLASKESRYGSLDALRRGLLRVLVCKRRTRRGGDVNGVGEACAAYKICDSSSSVSVSSSASSALSGYSGGRSEGSSTNTTGRCQGGDVYAGSVVNVESEESRRLDIRLR